GHQLIDLGDVEDRTAGGGRQQDEEPRDQDGYPVHSRPPRVSENAPRSSPSSRGNPRRGPGPARFPRPMRNVLWRLVMPLAPDVAAALRSAKQIYVATRRADGAPSKVVPVWFMLDGDAVYFTTGPASHKARRIARGSPLLVWVGRRDGPHFVGRAELVRDPAVAARMAPEYDRKYWIAWLGFFRPNPERVREGKTVIVRVLPGTR